MPNGMIIKAISGYYYVLPEGGNKFGPLVQCRARGIFKKKGITPLVGDRVQYEATENGEGTVDEIYPRTNELTRPPIANVDLAIVVFSVHEPSLNLQLLDKFLVHTEKAGLETIICLSKQDLLKTQQQEPESPVPAALSAGNPIDQVVELYQKIGYEVILSSAKKKKGTEAILRRLSGRIAVFSGQSGVGKSSLLNAMIPDLNLETNQISYKLGRGKHTTRHVELIPLEDSGWVADTPGFSQLDFTGMREEELADCFIEFAAFAELCKFRGCLHVHEPGCRVIEARARGEISASRYDHYSLFLQELREKKRRF